MDEFPIIKDMVKRFDIATDYNAIMACDHNGVIGFKEKIYEAYHTAVKASQGTNSVAGMLKTGKDRLEAIGIHESVHLIELALIKKNPGYHNDMQREAAWNDSTEATKIINEAYRRVMKEITGKGKSRDELVSEISRLAEKNDSECLSEAITDYHYHGGQAKLLSRIIYDVVKEILGGVV